MAWISRKRKEQLLAEYPIDTPKDLDFFDGVDRFISDVKQHKDETGRNVIEYPDGTVLYSDEILDKFKLIELLSFNMQKRNDNYIRSIDKNQER